jgi:hypothetical protein
MLKEIYKQICEPSSEYLQSSSLLTRVDDAFQCAIMGLPLEDGSNTVKSADNPQDAVLSKNGQKAMNGFHAVDVDVKPRTANGHKSTFSGLPSDFNAVKRQKYEISEIPLVLIDATIDVVLATLQRYASDDTTTTSIRNDARVLLRRLIRSGKVLARRHFYAPTLSTSGEDTAYGSANFLKLMQSLELSPTVGTHDRLWSAYTPFDLVCDMFQFCPDVSEREMVMALRYALFFTHPRDIASYVSRNKSLSNDHSLRNRCERWIEASKKPDCSTMKPDYKIVIAGVAFLMTRMAFYSQCNVSLLRDAYQNEFRPMEMSLFLGLIIDSLSDSNQFELPSVTQNGTRNILQHVATLCDGLDLCIRDNSGMNEIDLASIKRTLERAKKVVHSMTSVARNLLSLQRLLPKCDDLIPLSNTSRFERPGASKENLGTSRQASTALPPYQIERLLF